MAEARAARGPSIEEVSSDMDVEGEGGEREMAMMLEKEFLLRWEEREEKGG